MLETFLPLVLDGLLIALLLVTIVYAVILNRKLNRLRGNHDEMEVFVDKLNVACSRAETATAGLRNAGESGKAVFRESVLKAEALRDELAFLVERADIVTGRLATASEGTKVFSRDTEPQVSSTKAESTRKTGQSRPVSEARRGKPTGYAHKQARTQEQARPGQAVADDENASSRSEAEEELLRALRNAR